MPSTHKFGRESRLSTSENFQNVFKNGRKFRYQGISILALQNEVNCSRIGVCIPKRQIPRAVDRNRIRRIIKESFRLRRQELGLNLDLVFLVYSAMLGLSQLEINTCLDCLWTKLTNFYNKA